MNCRENCNNNISVLSQKKNCCLIKCKCCGVYQLSYKNIIINLTLDQIHNLQSIAEGVNEGAASYKPTSLGKSILIKFFEEMEMFMAFTKAELRELRDLIEESIYMDSVYQALSGAGDSK